MFTAIELTRKLIRFNTVSPPGRERECALFVGQILDEAGFHVTYQELAPERFNLIARHASTGTHLPLCLSGHLDTVPLGAADWHCDPFAGEIADGKIYGRGASDMKSGIAAMLLAALKVSRRPLQRAGLLLVFTAGEETGCLGAQRLAASREIPGPAGALVVGEPCSNYPRIGHKGAVWLEAVTKGATAHGSMPERGVNAIYKAALAVLKLQAFDFGSQPHAVLGAPTLNVGTITGGTNVNLVPDEARIGIDIRTIPGLDHQELLMRLGQTLGSEVELRNIVDARWIWTDPRHPWVQDVFHIMTPILGERPEPRSVSYFTDASILIPALGNPPTLILGPGEAAMAHQTNEYCLVDRIDQAVSAYEQIILNWCDR